MLQTLPPSPGGKKTGLFTTYIECLSIDALQPQLYWHVALSILDAPCLDRRPLHHLNGSTRNGRCPQQMLGVATEGRQLGGRSPGRKPGTSEGRESESQNSLASPHRELMRRAWAGTRLAYGPTISCFKTTLLWRIPVSQVSGTQIDKLCSCRREPESWGSSVPPKPPDFHVVMHSF